MFYQAREAGGMATKNEWHGYVEPDYFQFYARRASAEWASAAVSDEGRRDRLWSDGHFVYIGTLRKFGATAVDVEVLDAEPDVTSQEWQHVAEISLLPGGPFEVLSWNPDEPVALLDVPEESLRMRVLWKGLVAGRFEGMGQQGESEERMAIKIWPAADAPPVVVRRWDGWPL